jgi:hypothetical protein
VTSASVLRRCYEQISIVWVITGGAHTSASDAIINTGRYLIGLGDVVDEDVADCGRIVV